MGKLCILAFCLTFVLGVSASWYWPFGSDETEGEKSPPRLSELMAPATELIDIASDLASEGKLNESIATNRLALAELDRIERENPERAQKPEFATLRNKRAYVNAAIDSMLLSQVKANAKAVAVSDTTELERKLAEERGQKKSKSEAEVEQGKDTNTIARPETTTTAKQDKPATPKKPLSKRDQVMVDIANGDYAAADVLIREMLEAKPNGALALNLKATMEARQGKLKEAERTLDRAIISNPRDHFAYYNMAILMLQANPDNKTSAKRYYETGRAYGGPADPELEAMLK